MGLFQTPQAIVPDSFSSMTLLSTTSLTGTTVTLSSIPQTYNSLYLLITGVTGNTSNQVLRIMLNGSTSLHSFSEIYNATLTNFAAQRLQTQGYDRTNANNAVALTINNYTSSTAYKPFHLYGRYINASAANQTTMIAGAFVDNTAITSIDLQFGITTFAGGTALLYGVK